MHKFIYTTSLLAFVLIVIPSLSRADDTIKIGAMLCLTGVCAETGTSSLRGAELAVSELNNKGGILGRKVSLIVQDTKEAENSRGSVTAFKNLILDPEIKLLIGPSWSNGGLPLVPLLKKRLDLIVISPSLGVAEFNEASSNLFNLWPHDEVSTRGLANVAIKKGWRQAAIVSAQDLWAAAQADGFSDEFKKLGGEIAIKIEPLPNVSDFKAESFKIVQSKPDVILFTLWAHMNMAAKTLRQLNYTGGFLAVQMDKYRVAVANGSLEGTIFAQFPEPNPDFVSQFRARYKESPALSADTAYDSIMLIAHAATNVKSLQSDKLQAEMLRTEFDGASGRIVLDSKGGVKRQPQFFVVKGDTFDGIN